MPHPLQIPTQRIDKTGKSASRQVGDRGILDLRSASIRVSAQ